MSIKVYLHFEVDGYEKKTSKLTIPKKWVQEKDVADVIGLFLDSYNKQNAAGVPVDKCMVHLVDSGENQIYSNDRIANRLTEHSDYFIKFGEYLRTNDPKPKTAVSTNQLRCKNFGCNKLFSEEENHDDACVHHIAPPYFHDCVKGWGCCKDKKAYDWDEFNSITGCARGRHSTVNNIQIFANSSIENADLNAASPAPVLKSISDYNIQNPEAATAATSAVKITQTRKSSRNPDGTARCQNKGCQAIFRVVENNSTSCTYHQGQPVFHDAIKLWSCCPNIKCFDFDEFMKVKGCCVGFHDDGEIELNGQP